MYVRVWLSPKTEQQEKQHTFHSYVSDPQLALQESRQHCGGAIAAGCSRQSLQRRRSSDRCRQPCSVAASQPCSVPVVVSYSLQVAYLLAELPTAARLLHRLLRSDWNPTPMPISDHVETLYTNSVGFAASLLYGGRILLTATVIFKEYLLHW